MSLKLYSKQEHSIMLYLFAVLLVQMTTICVLKWGISLYCNDKNKLMLSNIKKKIGMKIRSYKTLTVENLVAGSLSL